uniref:Uncharacterized protein LOC113784102 n=1 Tax=Cicer arietinum TaxID=3827 RepID=A0A3Q7XI55_CICAR|nr:uncharacterized protein LOC113784102 [Cicer arietinum]
MVNVLWDELEDLRPTPSCVCPIPCSCKLSTTVRDFKHQEYISCFLKGLNEKYNNVRTHILFMDLLPSISKLYSLLVQQDLVPNSTHNPPDTSVAFNINTPNNCSQGRGQSHHGCGCGRGQPHPSMLCTHCHKNNHTVDTCYYKHGFPSGYRNNQFANSSSPNDSKNPSLSQPLQQPDSNNHLSKEYYQILINLLHHSKSDSATFFATKNSISDQSNLIVSSISNTSFVSNHLSIWIMELGAFDHVCPFIKYFSSIKQIKPISIIFPNGSSILAHFPGHVYFTSNLYLQNVLFIPQFNVFGFIAYASTLLHHRTKLDLRATKCIFLGFREGTKGYLMFDLHTHATFVSRNVVFYEHIFPYANPNSTSLHINDVSHYSFILFDDIDMPLPNIVYVKNSTNDSTQSASSGLDTSPDNLRTSPIFDFDAHPDTLRRSSRSKKASAYLHDFECNFAHARHHKSDILYPLSHVLSYSKLSSSFYHFISSISAVREPTCFKQAVTYSNWTHAMQSELTALSQNKSWTLTKLPQAKLTIVRLLLALASSHNWHLHQLDVHNAFLNGNVEEEVYIQLPRGLLAHNPNIVCKLHKSLYGLKQSSRKWFARLSSTLISKGYTQSNSDNSLFIKSIYSSLTALLIYVDDIIISRNNIDEISEIKSFLNCNFKIKDLGHLKYFLGLAIARSKSGIHISQRKYTIDILSDVGMLASKPCSIPMQTTSKFNKDLGQPFTDRASYRRLIGKLIYLTNMRPYISYVIQQLSQFMSSPTKFHYHAAIQILCYLKLSLAQGIMLSSSSSVQLRALCDSDWASFPDTRRSVSGFCIFLGDSLITWKSKN